MRRLNARLLIIAAVLSGPGFSQTTSWNTNGSNNWYSPAGINVGIGTTTPGHALDVAGLARIQHATVPTLYFATGPTSAPVNKWHIWYDSTNAGLHFTESGVADGRLFLRSGGSVGIGTTNPNARFAVQQWFDASGGGIRLVKGGGEVNGYWDAWIAGAGNAVNLGWFGGAALLTIGPGGNVGIGTVSPQSKLTVNGTVQAKEVVVNTGWADHVFRPGYQLKPLTEVAAFVRSNGHLPDIPTEDEVKAKGVGVGEMQAKLLAKIEELTLHLIKADERYRRLDEQNAKLEQQNRALQERMARLETAVK